MKPILILVLLISALTGHALADDPPRLATAEALLAQGEYGAARGLSETALARALEIPERERWQWVQAQAFGLEGDYEAAVSIWTRLSESSNSALRNEARIERAQCQIDMFDGAEAKRSLESIFLPPDHPLVGRRDELLAMSLYLTGSEEDALEKLGRLEQKSAAAWHTLGLIHFRRGNYEAADREYAESLKSAPGDYYSLLYRGWCQLELNRLDAARASLRAARAVADTPETHQLLGRIELRAGQPEKAESRFRDALERDGTLLESQFGLATALRLQGKGPDAEAVFKRFRELHLENQAVLRRTQFLEQEHLSEPDNLARAVDFALHYLSISNLEAAESTAWRALRIDGKNLKARLCLARALRRQGRNREAAVHYRRILSQDRQHNEARLELDELIRRHGRKARKE